MENLSKKKDATYLLKKSLNTRMIVEPVLYVNDEILKPLIDEHKERSETSTFAQLSNVAAMPTIVCVSSLPDVHCGYSFPIGTSAGFDLQDPNCVISIEGVGHDINCGVRSIATNLMIEDIMKFQEGLADKIFMTIPTGISTDNSSKSQNQDSKRNTDKDPLTGTVSDLEKIQCKEAKHTPVSLEGSACPNSTHPHDSDLSNGTITCQNGFQYTTNSDIRITDSLGTPGGENPIHTPSPKSPYRPNGAVTTPEFFPKICPADMNHILDRGVQFLVEEGLIGSGDLDLIENTGVMPGNSKMISQKAKARGLNQIGSLGSGNHYLEIQKVTDIYDRDAAHTMNIHTIGQIIVTIHTGSRGLGFQTCVDYMAILKNASSVKSSKTEQGFDQNIKTTGKRDRYMNPEYADSVFFQIENSEDISPEQASTGYLKFNSKLGRDYYSAMSSAANFAFCNRALIDYASRKIISEFFPESKFNLIYDVCHNIAKVEQHSISESMRHVLVHRKGASRAFPPNHPEIPNKYKKIGQPVLVGGSMGTCSYILVGAEKSVEKTLGSACHGAGRLLSRSQSNKTFTFDEIQELLRSRGIIVKCASKKGLVEEAPGSYKNVDVVVDICEQHQITRKIVRVEPVIVVKG